ncbi:S-adenosylmethionine-dependent methyltransferase Rv2258c-like isoform X2 [Argopecten irradians]|uniref:S-adenosylmethionine-dependent methyltransferase Rv2258c-like isoform X2 n=1 Tax=Argopecten irradians TaxID=31199 RepID=UPI003720487C
MDVKTYEETVSNFIIGGYVTSAIIIGKELGLFEELKTLKSAVTSTELAKACKLKERYVREWLGCMVSTRIISMKDSDRYFIPEVLKPGLKNALDYAFFSPVVGVLTDKVMECFKENGPDDPKSVIMDLGCGGGNLTRALRKKFPQAEVIGIDYNQDAITKAKNLTKIPGVKFLKEDATKLPADWTKKFDWVILYDVLHDLPQPAQVMKEVHRVLKDDGVSSIVDPDLHSSHSDNIGNIGVAAIGYAISSIICLPCSLSVPGAAGNGMGWGSENKEKFLTEAGWNILGKRNIDSPFALNFTCTKK